MSKTMGTYLAVKNRDGDWRYRRIKDGITQLSDASKSMLAAAGFTDIRIYQAPTFKTLEKHLADGVCRAPDRCKVEPDGVCSHGHLAWPIILGLM